MSRIALFLTTVLASAVIVVPAFAQIETVTVTAKRLAEARNGIQTQLGASTYKITAEQIEAQPGGENAGLNQVILQAPGAAEDSFGQLHIRGEHNGLQYRVNGVIIPEGNTVFSQTLNPRLAQSVQLITGALPAEYGLRTAGIIDVQAKTGLDQGGEVAIYGGSHSEINPSFDYGGSAGDLNYFVSGDYLTDTLGIESPDGSADPLHDRTKQWHGFAFAQDILDAHSSLTAIFGTSNDMFQIPNRRGQTPSGLDGIDGLCHPPASPNGFLEVASDCTFASEALNDNQREITHFTTVSYLRSEGPFDFQLSVFGRYSSLFFTPDAPVGAILFTGLAQTAYKRDTAYGSQMEGAYHFGDTHTVRAGVIYQTDDLASATSSLVVLTADPRPPAAPGTCPAADSPPNPPTICQTSATPVAVADNSTKHAWSYSLYLQDEWKLLDDLTINYGVRWDQFGAFTSAGQISPRINAVWKPWPETTVHAGYSRYFTPPPIELVSNQHIALFDGTTAASGGVNDTPKAERADYYDFGISQAVDDGVVLGIDSFYKLSRDLIDEGQFGAPIILTPFNYLSGRQYGVELTGSYSNGSFYAYANGAYERAVGKDIVSSQFNFSPDDLAYIATHFIPLDHQQLGSVSAGASYLWEKTRFSADLLFGTGLRADGATPNGGHVPSHATVNVGVSHEFELGSTGSVTARFDVINLFDNKYEIRDGSGVGVGEPQWGARRGFFAGLSKSL